MKKTLSRKSAAAESLDPAAQRQAKAFSALQWLLPLILVILWISARYLGGYKMQLLPTPISVVTRTVSMLKDGTLQGYILVSAKRAILGLIFGTVAGYFLGMICGMSKICNALLNTTIQMFRTIPMLGYLPVLIIFLGIGDTLKIFMVSMGVFFNMYLNTYGGVQGIDKDIMEMAQVYGFSKKEIFVHVILPGSMPSVLIGFRIALGSMWMMLIAAETVAGDSGLGYMTTQAREFLQMDKIFLVLFIYAFLGKLSDLIATGLEHHFLKWRNV